VLAGVLLTTVILTVSLAYELSVMGVWMDAHVFALLLSAELLLEPAYRVAAGVHGGGATANFQSRTHRFDAGTLTASRELRWLVGQ
jgi:hypothetical protein